MMVDDDKLMAFADGELSGEEREEVARVLAERPDLRLRVEEQRRLRETLRSHYGPVATEEVPDRLLALLGAERVEAEHGATVMPLSAARERRKAWRFPALRNVAAMAATFAIGIVAGQASLDGQQGPLASQNGMLVAQGDLRDALETQLASAPPVHAEHRIGVTFADQQGQYCRTFEGSDVSGLACRANGDWSVVVAEGGTGTAGSPEYRQAGSSTIMEAAQARMADAPLDAEAERALVTAGWERQ